MTEIQPCFDCLTPQQHYIKTPDGHFQPVVTYYCPTCGSPLPAPKEATANE